MADEPLVIRGINWRETFAFTNIFRSFRVAIHPSKLVLALLALLSLYFGGRILDAVWLRPYRAVPNEIWLYQDYIGPQRTDKSFLDVQQRERARAANSYASLLLQLGVEPSFEAAVAAAEKGERTSEAKARIYQNLQNAANLERAKPNPSVENLRAAYDTAGEQFRRVKAIGGAGIFDEFLRYEVAQIDGVVRGVISWNWLGGMPGNPPAPGVVLSVVRFFAVGPVWLFSFHPLYFFLYALLFLVVWSIFGGAIARIAAVHVAREEKLSMRQALRFSLSKFLSFFFAPVIPLIIVLGIGLAVAVGGLVFFGIPYVSEYVLVIVGGLLFFLVLAAGFVMTLVLLGTAGGFNLMYPTIAVEGSDSFDAISRSFSYVYARPWRMLFYTLVALVYGALTYLFVRLFIYLILALSHYFVDMWVMQSALNGAPLLPVLWPAPHFSSLPYTIDTLALNWPQTIGAGLITFWVYLTISMLGAFAISFYYSANTVIYYLMRREVDATELDDVYLEQPEEDFGEVPPAEAASAGGGTGGEVAAAGAHPGTAEPAVTAPARPPSAAAAPSEPPGETKPPSPPQP